MNEDEGTIPITADGLMVLRSDPALTSEAGIEDPFAAWFVTEAGRQLAQIALSIDPVYAIYNLARYRRFGALLARASQEFTQIVMLGAGYDTRAIWMQELREKRPRVFEVDVAATLATKAHVLAAHDVIMPETIVQVPADLNRDDLLAALRSCGFNEAVPSFVMAEGVTFFLDAQTVDKLLSPSMLGLAPGSLLAFDFWNHARLARLNEQVFAARGIRIFKPFPLPDSPDPLRAALLSRGFHTALVEPLENIARAVWPPARSWTPDPGWFLVEAKV
jgi:methyltransferase (TIGR00027 family)